MSYNKIILVCNLTKDPELKVAASGTTICNFSVAVNRKYKSGDEQKEEVSYFDIVAFGKQADLILQYLVKGSQVLIDGRLQQQRWDDKETGKGRSKVVVVAENVRFLGKKGGSNAAQPDQGQPEQSQPPQDHPAPEQAAMTDDHVPF